MQVTEEKKQDGDLCKLAAFYHDVFRAQKQALLSNDDHAPSLHLEEALSRAQDGLAALSLDRLQSLGEAFPHLVDDLCQVMDRHGLLDEADLMALRAAQTDSDRRKAVVERWLSGDAGSEPSDFLVSAAVFPWLSSQAEMLLPHLNLALWQKGICPICGAEPSFAAIARQSRRRSLLCTRCGTEWPFKRIGCPYCGNDDQDLQAYYVLQDGRYRVCVCEKCQRHLKAIDLAFVNSEHVSLLVESLLSGWLDEAADAVQRSKA